jgi:hypothetical protein
VKARFDIIIDEITLELWNIPTPTIDQGTGTRELPLVTLRDDESERVLGQEILEKHRALSAE